LTNELAGPFSWAAVTACSEGGLTMNDFNYKPDLVDRVTKASYHYIGRLFGGYRSKTLDRTILNAFHGALPIPAGEILSQQMKMFNHYARWRSRPGSQVTFSYRQGLDMKELDSEYKLPFSIRQEVSVASVRISARGVDSGPLARVDLFIFGGECESLKFDLSPKKIFGSYNPPIDDILITDIKVLFDPMNPDPCPTSPSKDFAALPEWVRSRIAGYPGASMSSPLAADLRTKLIDYYALPFPDDYLELVSAAEYLECPDCFEIFGLSKIWMYMTPREYVVVLSEVFGAGYICLLRNAPPGVYFIDHNLDHIPMHMGNSLKVALYRALDEGEDKIIATSKEYNS
jgi:hypothetical protein